MSAHISVGLALQAALIAGLAMRKRIGTYPVQCITIGQLGGSQRSELVRRKRQFQFGGDS